MQSLVLDVVRDLQSIKALLDRECCEVSVSYVESES
jgi:hypothetical protein